MLELARTGAGWLKDYEGWGAGTGAVVIEQGQEPREFLRHLDPSGGGGVARDVSFLFFFRVLFCVVASDHIRENFWLLRDAGCWLLLAV